MFRGGGETYTLNLVRELELMGVEVIFLTAKPIFSKVRYPITEYQTEYVVCPYLRDLSQNIANIGNSSVFSRFWRIIGGRLLKMDSMLFRWRTISHLKNNHKKYDLVQVLSHVKLASQIKTNLNIPTVTFFPGPPSPTDGEYIRCCSAVTTDGAAIKPLKEFRQDVVQIPIGVDSSLFFKIPSRIRENYGIPPEDIVLIFVGRFVPIKNVPVLLKAFRAACEDDSRLWLLLIGEGPLQKELEASTRQLGIDERVIFAGQIENTKLAEYYSAADIFILLSEYDNSPNAVVEAMSCGLPIIASRVGGIPSLVEDTKNAILVPQNDIRAAKEAISLLASDKETRQIMSKVSIERCKNNYDWKNAAARYQELYSKLVPAE